MLTIGKIAQQAQVAADTIRFYERERLITPTRKSDSKHRPHTEEAVRRVGFIEHACPAMWLFVWGDS